jgi:hypothetical protein
MEGKPLSKEELEALEQQLNMDEVTDLRHQKWMANRMAQAMQFPEVREALEELMQMLAEMGMDSDRLEELRQIMQGNQQSLEEQINQHVGQRIAENISKQERQEKADGLLNRPFEMLSEDDMRTLRQEVKRLAAACALAWLCV